MHALSYSYCLTKLHNLSKRSWCTGDIVHNYWVPSDRVTIGLCQQVFLARYPGFVYVGHYTSDRIFVASRPQI